MKKLIIVASFLGLGLTAGCSSKGSDIPGKIAGFKTQMCACTDAACTEKIGDAYREWKNEAKKDLQSGDKPSKDVMASIEKEESALRECQRKFDAVTP